MSQFEGEAVDGRPAYVRYKHGELSVRIGGDGPDVDEWRTQVGGRGDFLISWADIERATTLRFAHPPTVSAARSDDAQQIALLFRDVRTNCLPYLPALHTPDEDREFFRDTVLRDCSVDVARTDKLIAFCAYRDGWVDHLYVDPAYQGIAVGGQLLLRALCGQSVVHLWVFARNKRAISFYRRHGFVEERRTDGASNEEREPDVLMRWTAPQ